MEKNNCYNICKDSDIPTRAPYRYLKNKNNLFSLHNLNSDNIININQTTTLILELCDGKRSISDIVNILAEAFTKKPDNIKGDISNCLNQLEQLGLILYYKKNDEEIAKKNEIIKKNRDFYENKFPDIRETQKAALKQTHVILLRMLKIFNYLAEKHTFHYWLTFGTLLGAVRHKGFIPWDIDIDIAMTRKDYNSFLEKGAPNLPEDIFFQTSETDPFYNHPTTKAKLRDKYSSYKEFGKQESFCKYHCGIQMDIMIYDNFLQETFEPNNKKTSEAPSNINHEGFYYIFSKKDIFPLKYLEFEDAKFPVPNNYHKILTLFYGNYLKLPPRKKRTPNREVKPLTPHMP